MAKVETERRERIYIVRINRPEERNAVDAETAGLLEDAVTVFNEDMGLRVMVLTGAGEVSFCAGADLTDPEHIELGVNWEADYDWQLANIKKPLIAAVNGYCLGAGFTLALCCDIRIASEKASLGTPDQKLNTVDAYASIMLSRMIPASTAMEVLMTGDRLSAQEAYRVGLVSRIVPPSELMPAAEAIAKKICGNGPVALWACKELNRRTRYMSLDDSLSLFKSIAGPILKMDDTREGITAFFEKRPPVWLGR